MFKRGSVLEKCLKEVRCSIAVQCSKGVEHSKRFLAWEDRRSLVFERNSVLERSSELWLNAILKSSTHEQHSTLKKRRAIEQKDIYSLGLEFVKHHESVACKKVFIKSRGIEISRPEQRGKAAWKHNLWLDTPE